MSTLPTDPVIVMGMGSSGTRLVVRAFELIGFFMGGLLAKNEYAEPMILAESVHSFTDSFRYKLPLVADWHRIVLEHREDIVSFCRDVLPSLYFGAGYTGGRWGLKDPRLTFVADVYLKLYPDALLVHVLRDPRDIAMTKTKQEWRNLGPHRDETYWMNVWANVVTVGEYQCRMAPKSVTVRYEDLCHCTPQAIGLLSESLGIPSQQVKDAFTMLARTDRIGKACDAVIPKAARDLAKEFSYL